MSALQRFWSGTSSYNCQTIHLAWGKDLLQRTTAYEFSRLWRSSAHEWGIGLCVEVRHIWETPRSSARIAAFTLLCISTLKMSFAPTSQNFRPFASAWKGQEFWKAYWLSNSIVNFLGSTAATIKPNWVIRAGCPCGACRYERIE